MGNGWRLGRMFGAGAILIGAVAGLIEIADGLPKYWRRMIGEEPRETPSETIAPTPGAMPTEKAGSQEATSPSPRPSPTGAPTTGEVLPDPITKTAQRAARQRERFSRRLQLDRGQQEVVLDGRLGVAVTFAQVAGSPIATLRINSDRGQENHALLSGADSFVVTVDNTRFRLSVLRLDFALERAVIQVDQLAD